MTETYQNTNIDPRLLINADAIASRLEALDNTPLCDSCRDAVIPVAVDTVRLLIEAIRLWDALNVTRRESANRLAAMRAALHAAAESEPDPLAYLRYEMPGSTDNADTEGCR